MGGADHAPAEFEGGLPGRGRKRGVFRECVGAWVGGL